MAEESTTEQLKAVLAKLNHNQLRFVVAMQESTNKAEAAEKIDIQANTVYRWPDEVDEAIRLMSLDIEESAREIRRRAVAEAMMVKLDGLRSADETTRQKAATEIIEWVLGKAQQPVDMTTKGEKLAGPYVYPVSLPEVREDGE